MTSAHLSPLRGARAAVGAGLAPDCASRSSRSARGGGRLLGLVLRVLVWPLLMVPAAEARPTYAVLPPSALKQMTVEELLEQEVISVSRRPEKWGQAASSVFVIRADGARAAGATRLPQVLRLAPNLFVAQVNSSHWGVNARGFMRASGYSNKMLVMVDGRSVYSPFFSNVFWDSTDIFMPDLDRVEVISGPAGANWGSNAVNGIINILTQSAHLTQGSVIYAGAGTLEHATFGARHGGRIGESGAYRVYAKASKHGATLDASGADDDLDEWTAVQAGFRADWGTPGTVEYALHGDLFQGRFDAGADPQTRADGANLVFRWSRHLSPDANLTVRAYHDYAMRDIQRAYVARTRTSDLDLQYGFVPAENHELMFGAHYRYIDDRVSDTVNFEIVPPHLTFSLASLFVQHEYRMREGKLGLTTGLRVEHNEFSGWESQPHIRFAWRPSSDHTVWASAAQTTRTPSRLETGFFADLPNGDPLVVSNPHFRSEELRAYELGWRGLVVPGVMVSATLFEHNYDNLRTVEQSLPIVQANGGRGRSRGAEIFVDWDVTPWWRLRAGGSLIDQETWLKPGSLDADRGVGEASFPDHKMMLGSAFTWGEKFSGWFNLRWLDNVPTLENEGMGRVPSYVELDARVGWHLRSDLEVSITGRSLLDRSHPELGNAGNRREIPRSVQAMIRWDF